MYCVYEVTFLNHVVARNGNTPNPPITCPPFGLKGSIITAIRWQGWLHSSDTCRQFNEALCLQQFLLREMLPVGEMLMCNVLTTQEWQGVIDLLEGTQYVVHRLSG